MALLVATHSGPFHADDVLAFAMIRRFLAPDAQIIRTRERDELARADILIDVGGVYDPEQGRFDHHQASYRGALSSAGMVLEWLEAGEHINKDVAYCLKEQLVDYVDAVDNGQRKASPSVPCFSSIVATISEGGVDAKSQNSLYLQAVEMAERYIDGVRKGIEEGEAARAAVIQAMREAALQKRSVLYLERYLKWKPAYFENGGVEHPTDYVLFPAEGRWRVLAIPVDRDCIQNKRSLPEAWAGLTDEALSEVIGVEGALFCHKNRFIAVFETRDAALEALELWGLTRPPSSLPAPMI